MDLSTGKENGPKIDQPSSNQPPENDVVDRPEDEKGGVAETKFSEVKKNNINNNQNNLNPDDYANDAVLLEMVQQPHSQLPKPEAPPGVTENNTCVSPRDLHRSKSMPETYDFEMPDIGKFFREKSSSLSAAITKRISSLKESNTVSAISPATVYGAEEGVKPEPYVTEINLSGLQVIVNFKPAVEEKKLIGRVSFFSRSNCRDCTAVRLFLRSKNLNFVEINIDVFPMREKELIERTGNATVPQIFFNEKLFGGLVALNSMRNSGILDKKMEEMLAGKCPPEAPEPPVYGFDDVEEEQPDEMVQIVRVLRQRLPIQDRLMKMKIVKNCFSGGELVEVLIHHLDCGRRKAVEIGKELARKHFIHHVFGENEFGDGNHYYRFLEHESFILKCYNFRGAANDSKPKAAAILSQRLMRIMSAILEAYASDDRRHLDYVSISKSEEFRRYINVVEDLQRVNILTFSAEEKLAFFLNLYNAMAIHAVITIGHPGGMIDRRAFFSDFLYVVGGYPYSLTTIRNGILRSNRRAPFSLVKPFGGGDKRLELALPKVSQLSHFALCNGTRSSPAVKFFTPQGVESELRYAAREFFQRDDAMQVDLAKRTVYLTRIIKWYSADFGQEKEILKWVITYLDATKAGLLTHLLGDGGPVNVVYQSYDWSLNS
ncbi:hypothetical protein ACH5RR_036655 [Cinchona calisaya]|uniref:DEP domain-containing protein n=1 Tax=Cinchona calisaya TaxID=153742 RepID=A0ABD2Y3U3_9GENT